MLKIFSGIYGGRKIQTPPSELRPTSGRTREAAFNILSHGDFLDPETGEHALSQARVADVCCGSGAMGLEALSRGAAFCAFIDNEPGCLKTAEANAASYGAGAAAAFFRADCRELPLAMRPYDVIFLDPPYELADAGKGSIRSMLLKGWLRPGTLLVWEHAKMHDVTPFEPESWELLMERVYGLCKLSFFRYAGVGSTK